MSATRQTLGHSGFVFKGDWESGRYELLWAVRHNGNVYCCVNKEGTTDEPGASDDWALMVERGSAGQRGETGPQGPQGESGNDGFSPEVTIEEIEGGHSVTITDAEHPAGQTFNVMDGEDGASDAGDVTYDPSESYDEGTVGAELTEQSQQIAELNDELNGINTLVGSGEYDS